VSNICNSHGRRPPYPDGETQAAGLAFWTPIDGNYVWARFTLQLQGWSAPREFFAIRERIRENKSAVTRRLIDMGGHIFRVFVTNRQGDGAGLWRDYNQRTCCEQTIEELKNDFQAEGFCMKDLYVTEGAFLSVCFTYNLLSPYQHASAPEQRGGLQAARHAASRRFHRRGIIG
jgi:hypothetical protein